MVLHSLLVDYVSNIDVDGGSLLSQDTARTLLIDFVQFHDVVVHQWHRPAAVLRFI